MTDSAPGDVQNLAATTTTVTCPSCRAEFQAAVPPELPDDASSIRVECPECDYVTVLVQRAGPALVSWVAERAKYLAWRVAMTTTVDPTLTAPSVSAADSVASADLAPQ